MFHRREYSRFSNTIPVDPHVNIHILDHFAFRNSIFQDIDRSISKFQGAV